jgi:hypothetical protein
MGMKSFLYGYIEEAWPGARADGSAVRRQLLLDNTRSIEKHNDEKLQMLPLEDKWPPVSRHMFACPPLDASMINFRTRLIHFAASLKEVDFELRDWLDKFEALLRQLYWEKAVVHFDGAYIGAQKFEWRPAIEWVHHLTDGVLEPIVDWTFDSSIEKLELDQFRNDQTRAFR